MSADLTAVFVLWGLALVLTYLVFLPLIALSLWRAVRAACRIEEYVQDTLVAAQGIQRNLTAAVRLAETQALLADLAAALRRLEATLVQPAGTGPAEERR